MTLDNNRISKYTKIDILEFSSSSLKPAIDGNTFTHSFRRGVQWESSNICYYLPTDGWISLWCWILLSQFS